MLSQKLLVFDVRSAEEYAREHIAGSTNVPLERIEDSSFPVELNSTEVLYLICTDATKADLAAAALRRRGVNDVLVVAGGLKSWRALGYEIESRDR